MSGLRDIPIPITMPSAYKILFKKEREQKPAMLTKRIEIMNHVKRTNYNNEYDRISGLLEGQGMQTDLVHLVDIGKKIN